MVQKKLPTINNAHGTETRNIINEIIKAINDRGLEILSESGFLTWLEENGIKHREEVATVTDLPTGDSLNTVRGVVADNKIYIKKENGWVPFQTIDINKINEVDNRVSESLKTKVIKLDHDLIVTVGKNGDFGSINEALDHLTNFNPKYKKRGYKVEILLLSGFIMREQVHIKGINLGFITISSEDTEVEIDRQYITDTDEGYATKTAFLAYDKAVLPTINAFFRMNSTGVYDYSRVFIIRQGSTAHFTHGAGATGDAERLLSVTHGSIATATYGVFKNGPNIGVRVSNGGIFIAEYSDISGNALANLALATGMVNIDGANATNGGFDGIRLSTGPSILSADKVDVSNSGRYGVHVMRAGSVNFAEGKANECGDCGIFVDGGGEVYAVGAIVENNNKDNIRVIGPGSVNASNSQSLGGAAQYNIYVVRGGIADVQNSKALNAGHTAVLSAHGGTVNAQGVDASGAIVSGFHADGAGTIQANASITDADIGYRVISGSTINASNTTGSLSQTKNILTSNGVIFR